MDRLIAVDVPGDVPSEYRDSAIGRLLAYHNLGERGERYERPELLVGMCMDYRKRLRIPENFAFVIRTGGGNLRHSDFKVSFAIAVGGVRAIAVIGHSDCGMARVAGARESFVRGLVDAAGWDEERADDHFRRSVSTFAIDDPVDFTLSETRRLRRAYRGDVVIAPLHYHVEDHRLYLIRE
ncbi:MAG: carbonic anhydrase [Gemmatimonadota bacterium]